MKDRFKAKSGSRQQKTRDDFRVGEGSHRKWKFIYDFSESQQEVGRTLVEFLLNSERKLFQGNSKCFVAFLLIIRLLSVQEKLRVWVSLYTEVLAQTICLVNATLLVLIGHEVNLTEYLRVAVVRLKKVFVSLCADSFRYCECFRFGDLAEYWLSFRLSCQIFLSVCLEVVCLGLSLKAGKFDSYKKKNKIIEVEFGISEF